jgi:hypothetical protein
MSEKKKVPSFLEVARRFYGGAFGRSKRQEVSASMADWGEMSPAEQRFATAHLLYLNLEAQGAVLRALGRVGGALDEVADGLDQVLERGEEPAEPGDGDDEEETFDAEPEDSTPDRGGVTEGGDEGELIVDGEPVDARGAP